jgi:hypothetical protein
MKFNLTDEIAFPLDEVFHTHRDCLVELVDYLPNVEEVVVESREESDGVVKLVNRWKGASSDVPAPLRPVIKPEMLTWIDRAQWDESRHRCDWQITLTALPEAVTAKGFNLFLDEGDETVIQMSGEFVIHPEKVPGMPTFMAKRLAPTLEKFVVGLLQPNLKRSNKAVEEYLEDQA